MLSYPRSIIFSVRIAGPYTCSALLVSFLQFYLFCRWFPRLHMPHRSLCPRLRCPVYLRPLLGMYSASAGHPKIPMLSSFPLLLWEVVAGTMIANSVGSIDRIFLGEGNIWVLPSCHALSYINFVQSECIMSGCVVESLLEWHVLHVSSIC